MSSLSPRLHPHTTCCLIPMGCPSEGPCLYPDPRAPGMSTYHPTLQTDAILQPFHTHPHLTPKSPGTQPCSGTFFPQLHPASRSGWLHQHLTTAWHPADVPGERKHWRFHWGLAREGDITYIKVAHSHPHLQGHGMHQPGLSKSLPSTAKLLEDPTAKFTSSTLLRVHSTHWQDPNDLLHTQYQAVNKTMGKDKKFMPGIFRWHQLWRAVRQLSQTRSNWVSPAGCWSNQDIVSCKAQQSDIKFTIARTMPTWSITVTFKDVQNKKNVFRKYGSPIHGTAIDRTCFSIQHDCN